MTSPTKNPKAKLFFHVKQEEGFEQLSSTIDWRVMEFQTGL